MSFLEAKNKPYDWPVNGKEVILENIYVSLNNFIENPGYKTKESIVCLVSSYDLNQQSYEGIYRVSDFEVRLINTIFIKATQCNLNAVKTYIYTIISDTVRLQKSMSFVSEVLKEKSDIRIIPYEEGLLYTLKLYYFAYQRFNYEKDIGFAENIVFVMSEAISDAKDDQKLLSSITSAYISMMNDISYMSGNKKDDLWKFDREELKSLFTIEAKLIKKCSLDINKRPIKGVLLTQFSNYILKSRDGYNDEFICKYIPADAAISATENHQIWMRKVEKLNDDREQRVIQELFKDDSWINHQWAKKINFSLTRTYYVSSFSKNKNETDMNSKYGSCIFGFKNDRLVELLSPISMRKLVRNSDANKEMPEEIIIPVCSQVVAFDVIYDIDKAKEELNFLMEIIDNLCDDKEEKHVFLENIMQYLILSVKDSIWCGEKERRYVLFLYRDYDYIELEVDENFLKMKTSLFSLPDFILGDIPTKRYIQSQVDNARKALSTRSYLFCHKCLNRDYDAAIYNRPSKCPVCNSNDIEYIDLGIMK
ncbi:MAG: hypothetical protein RSC93_11305 [Erysipelotrichaceae bacterium]